MSKNSDLFDDDNARSRVDKMVSKAKAGDFFDDPFATSKPITKDQRNSVKSDRLDKIAWTQIRERVGALDDHVKESIEKHVTSGPLYEDLFNLLNQGDPRFTEVDRMIPEYLPQHSMLGGMHESEEFKYLRKETRYDEYNTALAMLTMKDRLDDSMDKLADDVEKIQQAAEALAEAIAAAEEALAGGASLEQVEGDLKAAMDAAGIAEANGQESADAMQAVMDKALKDAQESIDREKQAMAGYGLSDGELKRMPFEERRALAERFKPETMQRLARLLGKFRPAMDAERRRKVTNVPAEKYDVELGNDLEKLVPSEYEQMAMPELEEIFWIRYAKQELAQFKVRGIERAGKGPIIFVCDESGSMGCVLDEEGNTREQWSKAVALALADQAFRDKRDFTYIGFSSSNQVWQIDFPKGAMEREKVLDFATHFYGGGTSYEGPIQLAGKIVKEYGDRGNMMPDVVFATDDACHVSEAFVQWWRELKQKYDVSCYGLQIGGEPWANNLKDLSDHCIAIDKLNASPQGVAELFRTI